MLDVMRRHAVTAVVAGGALLLWVWPSGSWALMVSGATYGGILVGVLCRSRRDVEHVLWGVVAAAVLACAVAAVRIALDDSWKLPRGAGASLVLLHHVTLAWIAVSGVALGRLARWAVDSARRRRKPASEDL